VISSGDKIDLTAMSDPAILREIGVQFRAMRLARNLSQATLAVRAGVNRTTVIKLESGRAATLLTVVQILRGLDKLDTLSAFRVPVAVSPIAMLHAAENQRKRAYGPRKPDRPKGGAAGR
jgi:transcriptional regulator with XRE-family HTH domain